MARPWTTLDAFESPDGRIELRVRGDEDFLITVAGRVLMNSHANRSEQALARVACEALAGRPQPSVLVGGLGMGCTLRTALDGLPEEARVVVRELHPTLVDWCRGPLSGLNGGALSDARVTVEIGDVADAIASRARGEAAGRLDGIVLDLFEGPHPGTHPKRDPLYGSAAIDRMRRSLRRGGVLAVWSEDPDAGFEGRLGKAHFQVALRRPGRGGRRHAVYLATRAR